MKSVLIVVGHKNIENLTAEGLRSWRDVASLRKSTGASGERDYNWKVMEQLRDMLIAAGVQVYIGDAVYNKERYDRHYDLLVTLHYDGGGTEERCMIAPPLATANPRYISTTAQAQSNKFCEIWRRLYPGTVGVPNRNERITAGMTEHYLWDYVEEETPSVIIEHFNHTSARGTQLKQDPRLVAEGDFKAIKEFLGLSTTPTPTPTPPPSGETFLGKSKEYWLQVEKDRVDLLAQIDGYKKQVNDANTALGKARNAAQTTRTALTEAGL